VADFIGLFRRVSEAAVEYAFWIIERRVHTLAIDERDPTPDSALLLATAPYYGLKTPEAEAILARVRQVVATRHLRPCLSAQRRAQWLLSSPEGLNAGLFYFEDTP
jgi:hypothetical protein